MDIDDIDLSKIIFITGGTKSGKSNKKRKVSLQAKKEKGAERRKKVK